MDYPLSVSQAGSLRRCPQRWWWAYMDKLRPTGSKAPLWFGIGVHLALAEWYGLGLERGAHPAETWAEYCDESLGGQGTLLQNIASEDEEKAYVEMQVLGATMLDGYVKHWGRDEHEHWIATEKDFLVKIPAMGQRVLRKGTKPQGTFRGTFDGVYRDLRTDEIWLKEHKTSRDNKTGHLPVDPQATRYLYVATKLLRKEGLIGPREEIAGIDYNMLQKKMPPEHTTEDGIPLLKPRKTDYVEALLAAGVEGSEKGLLKLKVDELVFLATTKGITVVGPPSEAKREPLFLREQTYRTKNELIRAQEGIQAELVLRDALESGTLPVFKNPTRDCAWDCDFYRMCQLHEAGEAWEEFRDEMYTTTDPRREEMEKRKSA